MPIWILETALPWIKNNWKLLVVLALLAGAYHAGAESARAECKATEDARKLAEDKKLLEAQQSVIFTERASVAVNSEVSHDYENSVARIDSDYSGMLGRLQPDPAAVTTYSLPDISRTAAGNHAVTGAVVLSLRDKKAALALARQADLQTQQLIACQAWVAGQKKAHAQH